MTHETNFKKCLKLQKLNNVVWIKREMYRSIEEHGWSRNRRVYRGYWFSTEV